MTKLTSGIASALAIGETSDTCWNSTSSRGARPAVTAHCTLPHCASQWALAVRPVATKKITATAANESQKPGERTAQGSSARTMKSAAASTREAHFTVLALDREEEHPSALQPREKIVWRHLLEKQNSDDRHEPQRPAAQPSHTL